MIKSDYYVPFIIAKVAVLAKLLDPRIESSVYDDSSLLRSKASLKYPQIVSELGTKKGDIKI